MEFEALAIHYVLVDDKVQGPFSLRQLNEMHGSGTISENAFYSVKGIEGWHPIAELFKPAIVKPPPMLSGKRVTEQRDVPKKGRKLQLETILGVFLIILGQVIALYYFAYFNPSEIQLAPGPIDPGLIFHQQNGMHLGLATMILGGLLYASGCFLRTLPHGNR